MKFKIEIGKESIIIIIENDVEFGRNKKKEKGAWNQKSHERKSKNYIKYKENQSEKSK